MDHYIDIKVLPDPEFNTPTLMNAVYSKLHRALASFEGGSVGVSFPDLRKTPGPLLRIHSEQSTLNDLMGLNWLKGLGDYTEVTSIKPVPADVSHVSVKRVQHKLTAARIRRAVKRNSLTESAAESMLDNRAPMQQPFFRLQSQSTKQHFLLFIEQSDPQDQPVRGEFNAYGLSQGGTVPWF